MIQCARFRKQPLEMLLNKIFNIDSDDCEFKTIDEIIKHYENELGFRGYYLSDSVYRIEDSISNLFIFID